MGILELIEQSGGLGSVAREPGINDAFGSPDVSRTVAPTRSGPAFGPSEGHAGLGSLLDLNGDGNPLDDILSMAGKLLR